jgi:uncharacterized damage-inducible protein DinB
MEILNLLQQEVEAESAITRKMLQRVPADKWDWKPHEKSMSLKQLTLHIAELPGWVAMALQTSELDFAAQPYTQPQVEDNAQLLQIFEKALQSGKEALQNANEDDLTPDWTLRNGEQVLMKTDKYGVIRHSISQTIHHRAQLGVYLRLLNILIPGSYGPSADEANF